jgi:ABC-type bacteriocin/lantibiotic exporter with double-glycine peptidase domain
MTATHFAASLLLLSASGPQPLRLAVPIVAQAPERCGPTALSMVLRFHGAPDSALARAEAAYDPVLRGALITDLSRAAEQSGYAARVETADPAMLRAALEAGTPPIVLYDVGFGPLRKNHYAVIVAWDPGSERFTLHDGGNKPRAMKEPALVSRWKRAGSLALFVTERP